MTERQVTVAELLLTDPAVVAWLGADERGDEGERGDAGETQDEAA
jgi:hypothetical protein